MSTAPIKHTKSDLKIVCAAVKINDCIIPCIRHWDANCHYLADHIWDQEELNNFIHSGCETQGFLDNKGNFHTREDAAKIVGVNKKQLYSEDLY